MAERNFWIPLKAVRIRSQPSPRARGPVRNLIYLISRHLISPGNNGAPSLLNRTHVRTKIKRRPHFCSNQDENIGVNVSCAAKITLNLGGQITFWEIRDANINKSFSSEKYYIKKQVSV